MYNKKGSHVGVILSFVVFVTFLIFLYVVLEPMLKVKNDKELALGSLKEKLIDGVSADLTSLTISFNEDYENSCLKIIISGIDEAVVKDKDNNIVNSEVSGENIKWELEQGKKFFKIYYSDEFENEGTVGGGCAILSSESIKSVKTEEKIFETKILSLIDEYSADYESLKKRLNIPKGMEFGFGFEYADGNVVETKEKDVPTSVYAEKIPVQYVDKTANIKVGFAIIKVW